MPVPGDGRTILGVLQRTVLPIISWQDLLGESLGTPLRERKPGIKYAATRGKAADTGLPSNPRDCRIWKFLKPEIEPWSVGMQSTTEQENFVAQSGWKWTPVLFLGASLLVHALFFLWVHQFPPAPSGFDYSVTWEGDNRYVNYMIAVQVQPEKESHPPQEIEEGPSQSINITYANEEQARKAQTAKILDCRSDVAMSIWPFGKGATLEVEPEDELGALSRDYPGRSYGYGGLGISAGHRGGGTGEATVNLGSQDSRSRGGSGRKRLQVKAGEIKIKGKLSRDVVGRVVRRNINQVKYCFRHGLKGETGNSHQFEVKFVVTDSGSVEEATGSNSTLDDEEVERCIVSAIRRLTFPQPEDNGKVVVAYPFFFETTP